MLRESMAVLSSPIRTIPSVEESHPLSLTTHGLMLSIHRRYGIATTVAHQSQKITLLQVYAKTSILSRGKEKQIHDERVSVFYTVLIDIN